MGIETSQLSALMSGAVGVQGADAIAAGTDSDLNEAEESIQDGVPEVSSGVAYPECYIPHRRISGCDALVSGQRTVGDKARELERKHRVITEAGFRVAPMYMLAEGFFDAFFRANGLGRDLRSVRPSEDFWDHILQGRFTTEQHAIIDMISGMFNPRPLAVRSSAAGDSRGTNTYATGFTKNTPARLERTIREVLASYFTEKAQIFRRLSRSGEEMGIFIQPVIGQWLDKSREDFAPVLSGYGYTTGPGGEPVIYIEWGLSGAVSSDSAECIPQRVIEGWKWSLKRYVETENSRLGESALRSNLLGFAPPWGDIVSIAVLSRPGYGVHENHLCPEAFFGSRYADFSLEPLFSGLTRLEARLGSRQYVEFAITVPPAGPQCWITQVAEVSEKTDWVVFEDSKNALFACDQVTGAGERICDGAVICDVGDDGRRALEALRRYNRGHENYLLFFSGQFLTDNLLDLTHFSNAPVLIDMNDYPHTGPISGHFRGLADVLGKFLARLKRDSELGRGIQWLRDQSRREDGLFVYDGKLRAKARESEKKEKGRLVVYKVEQ